MSETVAARWISYFVRSRDTLQQVTVDVAPRERIPDPALPILVRISVPVVGSDAYFFTPGEGETIDRLADGLLAVAAKPRGLRGLLRGGASALVYVGREAQAGEVRLYFHAERAPDDRALAALRAEVPGLGWKLAWLEDQGSWRVYLRDLHPGPALDALLLGAVQRERRRALGDDLPVARPVDHTLLFAEAAGRQAFLEGMGPAQAEATAEPFDASGDDHRYGLTLTIEHPVTAAEVEPYVVALAGRASEHGGTYDGWGAPIVRPPGSPPVA